MEFSTLGYSDALTHAIELLNAKGWNKTSNAKIVILPVPSFEKDGTIKGGGTISEIPKDALVIGGKLGALQDEGFQTLDLLENPLYLSENAAITAYCALQITMQNLPVTLHNCSVLVIGWGRIGKCLVRLLRLLGAKVTVAARKEPDRALLEALGYTAIDLADRFDLSQFRVIINTADSMVLPLDKQSTCRKDCVKVDLSSLGGIEGNDVIWARGLPSMLAPESSGALIAKVILKEVSR